MARPTKRPEFHEWRPHPWHGLSPGRELPLAVNAYIEISGSPSAWLIAEPLKLARPLPLIGSFTLNASSHAYSCLAMSITLMGLR